MGQGSFADIGLKIQRGHNVSGDWARDGDRRPVLRRVMDEDAIRVVAVLSPGLKMRADTVHMAGRAGYQEALRAKPRDHTVVIHNATFGEHEGIADPTRR